MLTGLIYLVFTGFTIGSIGILITVASRKNLRYSFYRPVADTISFTMSLFLFGKNFQISFLKDEYFLCLIGIFCFTTISGYVAVVMLQKVMTSGPPSIVWTISQASMIFPFIFSMVFWGEDISVLKIVGIVCIFSCLIIFGVEKRAKSKFDLKDSSSIWFLYAMLIFVIFGVQQIFLAFPSKHVEYEKYADLKVLIVYVISLIFSCSVLACRKKLPSIREMRFGVLFGLVGLISVSAIFTSLDELAKYNLSGIVFPASISIGILVVTLNNILVFKEKITKFGIAGILTGIAGLVSIMFSG